MLFKDGRLEKDPELIELRKQFRELGECCPGYNYDCFSSFEEYKAYCREELAKLKESKK